MNLIFCFDGTSNDPSDAEKFAEDGSISNVLKLHAMFGGTLGRDTVNRAAAQHSFYYSGVGTRGNVIQQLLNAMFAPADGDREEILAEANADLQKNYQDGDEIFVFGFSRGAALARIFAANLAEEGKSVRFLGVFDTVAAMKGSRDLDENTYPPSAVLFENGTMGQHIERAVHVVALDERRVMFQPTLFNEDERITEVWFPGVHSDIGGGFWFDGLSDVALDFMLDRARNNGLEAGPDKVKYEMLEEGEHKICADDIAIIALANGTMHTKEREGLISQKTLAPRLVRVNRDDAPAAGRLPIIHHTVAERFMRVTGYRPYNLRDVKYRVMSKNGEVGEMDFHGIAGLKYYGAEISN